MKKILLTLTAIAGALSAFTLSSVANANTESFRQTCRVVFEDQQNVQAYCLDTSGRQIFNNSSKFCTGDLANMNGYITCSAGSNQGGFPQPGFPDDRGPGPGQFPGDRGGDRWPGQGGNRHGGPGHGPGFPGDRPGRGGPGHGQGFPPPGQGGFGMPRGSYQFTCNSCYTNGDTLSCSCEDTAGYYHATYLNYRSCRSEIANLNGRLICN
jgi:hypothetical protein